VRVEGCDIVLNCSGFITRYSSFKRYHSVLHLMDLFAVVFLFVKKLFLCASRGRRLRNPQVTWVSFTISFLGTSMLGCIV
jgi:hypothetical protein